MCATCMVDLLANLLEAGISLQGSNLISNSTGPEARGILGKSTIRPPSDTEKCSTENLGDLFLKRRYWGKARFLTHSSTAYFSCENSSPFVPHSVLGLCGLSAMLPGHANVVGFDEMGSFMLEARQRPAVH